MSLFWAQAFLNCYKSHQPKNQIQHKEWWAQYRTCFQDFYESPQYPSYSKLYTCQGVDSWDMNDQRKKIMVSRWRKDRRKRGFQWCSKISTGKQVFWPRESLFSDYVTVWKYDNFYLSCDLKFCFLYNGERANHFLQQLLKVRYLRFFHSLKAN